jgi:glycosyl transferase, family 25
MKTYVISLARRPDRRAHITGQLDKTGIDYEILDAIDGRDLDLRDARLFDPVAVSSDTTLDSSCFGCALSHLEIYRRMLEEGLEKAFILEDDVNLPADLDALLDAVAKHMTGAEVVLLNFHLVGKAYEACRVTRTGSTPLPSNRLLVEVVEGGFPGSTGAYLITRDACTRMARIAVPVKTQPDDWAFFFREGAIDHLKCVVPMPVDNSSAIRTTKETYPPGSIQARILESVNSARIPVVYQALALRRRWGLRRHWRPGRTEFVEDLPGSEFTDPDGSDETVRQRAPSE